MNKTININLAGIIFHLDEVAYEKFKTYLSNVKTALGKEESGEEIIADIEARIAEIKMARAMNNIAGSTNLRFQCRQRHHHFEGGPRRIKPICRFVDQRRGA